MSSETWILLLGLLLPRPPTPFPLMAELPSPNWTWTDHPYGRCISRITRVALSCAVISLPLPLYASFSRICWCHLLLVHPILLMASCSQPATSALPSIRHPTQRTNPTAHHAPDPFLPSSTGIGQPSSPLSPRPRRGPCSSALRPLRALLHPPRNPPRVKRELSGSHRGAIFTSISIRIARASRACFAPVRTFCDVVEACGRHVGSPWTSTA